MPDLSDEKAAYRDALARAEASASEFDENGDLVTRETPAETPELPDAVPVAASDQPLDTETVAETDTSVEQPAPPAVETRTVEQLEAELAAATARIEEQKSLIGRHSTEVGETREEMRALRERLDALTVVPAAPTAPQMQITQDMIDTNPAYAVQLAYQQNNEQALKIAYEAWSNEEPANAASWRTDRLLEEQQKAFDAKIAETEKKITKVTAVTAEDADQQAWKAALVTAGQKHPDIHTVDPATGKSTVVRLLDDVAPEYPNLIVALSTGDAKAKAEALEALYALDKIGNPDQYRAELAKSAEEAAAESAAALAGAAVVAGQTTAGQEPVEKTSEQLEQEAYVTRMSSKPSLSKGWTGR